MLSVMWLLQLPCYACIMYWYEEDISSIDASYVTCIVCHSTTHPDALAQPKVRVEDIMRGRDLQPLL